MVSIYFKLFLTQYRLIETQLYNEFHDFEFDCHGIKSCNLMADPNAFYVTDTTNVTVISLLPSINNLGLCQVQACTYANGKQWLEFWHLEYQDSIAPSFWWLFGIVMFFRLFALVEMKLIRVGKK